MCAAYCRRSGRSYPIEGWNFYQAFSVFRLASIGQGVYAPRCLRQRVDGSARRGTARKHLAEQALALLQEVGRWNAP